MPHIDLSAMVILLNLPQITTGHCREFAYVDSLALFNTDVRTRTGTMSKTNIEEGLPWK